MAHRIEVFPKTSDTRAEVRQKHLNSLGFNNVEVRLADVYTADDSLSTEELSGLAGMLSNPVTQQAFVDTLVLPTFDQAVEIGFLPGVTDNIGNTASEIARDALGKEVPVYSSQLMFLSGVSQEQAREIGNSLANPLIQRITVRSWEDFTESGGMNAPSPRVHLHESPPAESVDILNVDDDELVRIGKQGIADKDGTRRGPLALDLAYMNAIKTHFAKMGRNPTDIELETIAQTWSEHCKHTIFADPIDDIKDGLFRTFIKAATERIRKEKEDKDFCVSVFSDNAGGIVFDDEFLVCDKAETHNSPSALDPFGGSITGIVGVNRDPMGFGMGAKPIFNGYFFCFADPNDSGILYKGTNKAQPMLSPRRIMDGVIDGVRVGGNCSGIPTVIGGMNFDSRYKGKPLVFVRTGGIIPRGMHEKQARSGDYIVMAGGRVGKDGIHGATFSSEAIDSGSPATAVQIGDPITQKKESDAIIKEARNRGLYSSITDDGAGGLSCSVGEMAKESGGAIVYLENVPLKYPGLREDEIWISESQERMTLSVPREKWPEFSDLMKSRGVEATVIGEFTDSGKVVVESRGRTIVDLELGFLHDGLPPRPMKSSFSKQTHDEPSREELNQWDSITDSLNQMLARKNIASYEFISEQYDHEVQGGSVLKPLQGRGRVNNNAVALRPRLDSLRALVLSHGINPSYSDIDTYDMAANAIDSAVRSAVAAGADLEHLALLDNFCWCSSNDSERLGQLVRACKACYDTAVAYGTPFISGKDSMFNDFKGFDEQGNPIKISVPPTLLVSTIGVVKDARNLVSIDVKSPGDLVYVVGKTRGELGGSEYFAMVGEKSRERGFVGNSVPKVDTQRNLETYRDIQRAIELGVISSAISVDRGGLGVALAKTAMAGMWGLEIDIRKAPGAEAIGRDDSIFYSESAGRFVITIPSDRAEYLELNLGRENCACIGRVRGDDLFIINSGGRELGQTDLRKMQESYRGTFKEF